jgi:hypothetical protein
MEPQNTIRYDSIIITKTITQIYQLNSAPDIVKYDKSGYKSRHDDFDNLDSIQSCEGDYDLNILSKSGELTKIRAQFEHDEIKSASVVLAKVLKTGEIAYSEPIKGICEPLSKMVNPRHHRPWSPVFTRPI